MIISPCISICKTDPSTGYCYGCGRSNEEKLLWKKEDTSDNWKINNIETLNIFQEFLEMKNNPHQYQLLKKYGGFDFNKSNFNRVIQAKRQPGSSFKPFVYMSAL